MAWIADCSMIIDIRDTPLQQYQLYQLRNHYRAQKWGVAEFHATLEDIAENQVIAYLKGITIGQLMDKIKMV